MTGPDDLHTLAGTVLLTPVPVAKCAALATLRARWEKGELPVSGAVAARAIDDPGRPARPLLVPPAQLPRRGLGTAAGRLALAHALAHIEFNAINLAVDAVYRFRGMPGAFYSDWLGVASEEASHFELLSGYLRARGCAYGDFPAHGGLWEAACLSADDVVARMALVPRVLEARGLDVTPPLIAKLRRAGDAALVTVLERIYTDEIEHVRIGNGWFEWLCAQRGADPRALFRTLIESRYAGRLRGPFNREARAAAGFSAAELHDLDELGKGG